ncbi:MAG: DMT family transporter, partial [Pseudomonadota bacterium]
SEGLSQEDHAAGDADDGCYQRADRSDHRREDLHDAKQQNIFVALIAGYVLWFRVVQVFPAMIASIGALVTPIIGVAGGVIFLGEAFTWREALALVLVLTAVALVIFQKKAAAS